jgi:hypothetical protein
VAVYIYDQVQKTVFVVRHCSSELNHEDIMRDGISFIGDVITLFELESRGRRGVLQCSSSDQISL